jgi:hypothetical protein
VRSLAAFSGLLCGLAVTAHAHAEDGNPSTAPDVAAPSAPVVSARVDQSYAIAVVANENHQPLVARLRAELIDLGFRVEDAPQDLSAEALDALTSSARLLAVVRIDEATQAIEFRVRVPDSGELVRERVALRPRRADVSAVATVELLRARLIKLGILRAAPAPLPPPPAPDLTPTRADSASVSLDVNAGAWFSAGGLDASPALVFGLRAHPKSWLAVGALGAFEPQASAFSAQEGAVHSRATLLGVVSDFGFGTGRTHFELGGGIALSWLTLSGDAEAPYAGRETHSYGVAPLLRSNLSLRLAGTVSLHSELIGGISSPRVAVRFADRTVAHWGRPFGLAVIGLEVGF